MEEPQKKSFYTNHFVLFVTTSRMFMGIGSSSCIIKVVNWWNDHSNFSNSNFIFILRFRNITKYVLEQRHETTNMKRN